MEMNGPEEGVVNRVFRLAAERGDPWASAVLATEENGRLRKALEDIQVIAAREWVADETNYEWYGDIAGIAESALGMNA